MLKITYIEHDGTHHEVPARVGATGSGIHVIRIMPNGDTAGARGAAIEALKLTRARSQAPMSQSNG